MKRRVGFRVTRSALIAIFGLALAWAQFRESGLPQLAAHLGLAVEPLMPALVYPFKNGQPFRLSPVQAVLPLNARAGDSRRLSQLLFVLGECGVPRL